MDSLTESSCGRLRGRPAAAAELMIMRPLLLKCPTRWPGSLFRGIVSLWAGLLVSLSLYWSSGAEAPAPTAAPTAPSTASAAAPKAKGSPSPPAPVARPAVTPPSTNSLPALTTPEAIAEKWGIEITRISTSAGGMMIDFRYRVLDPVKAFSLTQREVKPYLLDEASGHRFVVPTDDKTGPLRQTSRAPKKGSIYFMFFANRGKTIHAGSKVTIVIGDFKAGGLTVE